MSYQEGLQLGENAQGSRLGNAPLLHKQEVRARTQRGFNELLIGNAPWLLQDAVPVSLHSITGMWRIGTMFI